MTAQRMQTESTVGLVSVQKNSDRGNRYVSKTQRDPEVAPKGQVN